MLFLILHDHRRSDSESCHILMPDFSTEVQPRSDKSQLTDSGSDTIEIRQKFEEFGQILDGSHRIPTISGPEPLVRILVRISLGLWQHYLESTESDRA